MKLVQDRTRERAAGAIMVAAVHGLLGYALLTGTAMEYMRSAGSDLKLFDVALPPPPPPPPVAPVPREAAEGASAPSGPMAQASPVVAPIPQVRLVIPSPITAAPEPGIGSSASAGAWGSGGPGTGTGGNGMGSGSGLAKGARHLRGRLVNSDYPSAARRAGAEGTVFVRFTIDASGRATGCNITRSSGNRDLDATTCRLIERRFRYEPARDEAGRAIAATASGHQVWWLQRNHVAQPTGLPEVSRASYSR
jgi:protein TonB